MALMNPALSGDTAVMIIEDRTQGQGELDLTDLNNNNVDFVAGDVSGTYGTLNIVAEGTWSYVIDGGRQKDCVTVRC